jgi:hypothetical protein
MTTVLGAAAAAVAIAVAPIATTAGAAPSGPSQDQQSCVNLGGTQTLCQSPGIAQVYDTPG